MNGIKVEERKKETCRSHNCNYQDETKGTKEDNGDWRLEKYKVMNEQKEKNENRKIEFFGPWNQNTFILVWNKTRHILSFKITQN